jgi:molybdopterin-guanine dinucleotide biosynthesis protein A
VVLAGGLGRRIGGGKAIVELCGSPLLSYPLRTLGSALDQVAVLAKADTALPTLPGVTVWIEPQQPRHPLLGILQALALAGGRPVVVCAVDLPFVSPELIVQLATIDAGGAPAVLAARCGAVQPLLGRYEPAAAELLPQPAGHVALIEAVTAIGPRLLEVTDPDELFNVNAPEDLLHASAILDRRRARATRT